MADITLADYTGYIFLELIKAREMADRHSRHGPVEGSRQRGAVARRQPFRRPGGVAPVPAGVVSRASKGTAKGVAAARASARELPIETQAMAFWQQLKDNPDPS